MAGDATWVDGRNVYSATDARSQGIELEATGRVLDGVELSASLTHTDIEDAGGKATRTFLPRDTARVSVRYAATDKLSTTAALRWQSAIHRNIGGVRVTQDSYALLDVGASYQIDKRWKVSAQIRNLTDQKYINSLYWDQAFYGAPRHGQVSVNWTY
jgi:outer membrane receptor for ferric coprogen and ferric-rhodotorulic acid